MQLLSCCANICLPPHLPTMVSSTSTHYGVKTVRVRLCLSLGGFRPCCARTRSRSRPHFLALSDHPLRPAGVPDASVADSAAPPEGGLLPTPKPSDNRPADPLVQNPPRNLPRPGHLFDTHRASGPSDAEARPHRATVSRRLRPAGTAPRMLPCLLFSSWHSLLTRRVSQAHDPLLASTRPASTQAAVFIGHFNWWTRDSELLALCTSCGVADVTRVCIVTDPVNGSSKG